MKNRFVLSFFFFYGSKAGSEQNVKGQKRYLKLILEFIILIDFSS
jgi:hypothetical protein